MQPETHNHQDSSDFKYIECVIFNESDTEGKTATFNQTLLSPLLNKASDYYMEIESFNLDRISIPILDYKNDWIITFERNGVDYQETCQYITRGTSFVSNQGVYNLNQFQDIINQTLESLHNISGGSGNIGVGAPFLRLNPVTRLFSMYISTGYDADIYFNTPLNSFFSFDVIFSGFTTDKTAQIRNVPNLFNQVTLAGTDYNQIIAIENTLWLLNDLIGVIITSNSLPVQKEIVSFGDNSTFISNSVLQRFFQIFNISEETSKLPLNYVSEQDNYLIDLVSPLPLSTIGFTFNILYKNNDIIPLLLEPKTRGELKLKFIKKSFFNHTKGKTIANSIGQFKKY